MSNGLDREKLNILMKLNSTLASDIGFVEKMDLVSETIKDIIKADRCSVFVYDRDTHSFWSAYIDGVSYLEVPDDKGVVSQVFKTKETIVVNDTKSNPNFYINIDKATGYDTKSILAMPIIGYDNRCLGVIQLLNKLDDEDGFNEEDTKVLQFVINHIATFVELLLHEN